MAEPNWWESITGRQVQRKGKFSIGTYTAESCFGAFLLCALNQLTCQIF